MFINILYYYLCKYFFVFDLIYLKINFFLFIIVILLEVIYLYKYMYIYIYYVYKMCIILCNLFFLIRNIINIKFDCIRINLLINYKIL